MTFYCLRLPLRAAWLIFVCVVLTGLDTGVALADNADNSRAIAISRDTELLPWMQAEPAKPRYAGWLLAAYLVPPVVAAAGIAAESGETMITSAALMWLAPSAVHLVAGEYGLAVRAALVVVGFAVVGVIVGGLIGFGVAELVGQNQESREEIPGLQRVIGLVVGGLIGGSAGLLTWAIIDVSQAFARDASRAVYARGGVRSLVMNVRPTSGGIFASLAATF